MKNIFFIKNNYDLQSSVKLNQS